MEKLLTVDQKKLLSLSSRSADQLTLVEVREMGYKLDLVLGWLSWDLVLEDLETLRYQRDGRNEQECEIYEEGSSKIPRLEYVRPKLCYEEIEKILLQADELCESLRHKAQEHRSTADELVSDGVESGGAAVRSRRIV
eukprot:CAMPEP_0185854222 /NCGR_PEP_ID=MMETSP1354-20130828/21686_1 /TAXON_ID=708628 /ORGANISM="Erythrolobus madagascarensis, Strain CCMP3276" /LENGTH=137 /DNA_ID=CAMNT_0028555929 /DNA_START=158 /DNA_END=571 /DNA_ORIENTATION=+